MSTKVKVNSQRLNPRRHDRAMPRRHFDNDIKKLKTGICVGDMMRWKSPAPFTLFSFSTTRTVNCWSCENYGHASLFQYALDSCAHISTPFSLNHFAESDAYILILLAFCYKIKGTVTKIFKCSPNFESKSSPSH